MRDRLLLIDARSGGKVLQTLDGRRGRGCKLWVSTKALMEELRTDHARRDADLSELRCRLEGVERRVSGLGRAHRRLDRNVSDFRSRQERINAANVAAIQAVQAFAHTVAEDESKREYPGPRAG